MKRSKSGAQKRKKAATARDAVAKLPKIFFVLCSSGKLLRDVYSQIYFDVSPGNGRQASSEKHCFPP